MLESGDADLTFMFPAPSNLNTALFPLTGGLPDRSKRLGTVGAVWVKRAESPLEWEGNAFVAHAKPIVGIRSQAFGLTEPIRAMGFTVMDTAIDSVQLLRMLQHGRFDVAAIFDVEAAQLLQRPEFSDLRVLKKQLDDRDIYAVVRRDLPQALMSDARSLWENIARLRDQPEFRSPKAHVKGAGEIR